MLREINLVGEPYAHGLEFGRQLHAEIRAFLEIDREAVFKRLPRPPADLYEAAGEFATDVEKTAPEIWADLRGLAEGSRRSLEEILYIQYRREVVRKHAEIESQDCSLFALQHARWGAILGQTIDLEPYLRPFGVIVRTAAWQATPSHIQYSFAGLLGYAGLNTSGLCVGINMLDGGRWDGGLSPYLLVRLLLQQQGLSECLSHLQRTRRSSSRCITLLAGESAISVEMLPDSHGELHGLPLVHTNHFEHPSNLAQERSNLLARANSRQRQAELKAKLQALATEDIDGIRQLLASHENHPDGICFHSQGKAYRNETVAAVVMAPRDKRLYALQGSPCEQSFTSYPLRQTP
ncbi:MAG: C45 family autoproteolytic acyltransferase/hydrolase [Betaproteobacteria bacterium]